jgi:poly-beta-1,6-N-acetyl-D-glucosamine synthase
MIEFFKALQFIIENGIIFITIFIFGSYATLAVFSGLAMLTYMRKNSFVDYKLLLSSPLAPSISIVAPAFNEGKTIVDNIRSMLSLHYNDYEVIIINDGSNDDTMQKIIKAYDLIKVNIINTQKLKTKPIRGVYRSTNQAFSKLLVIDKENGGKADALNAGINFSTKEYFSAIDVDCVLVEDALLIMAKPFLEETNEKIIASGGVIRIANSCLIENGHISQVRLPRKLIPRIQVLEYTRAFLLGRMAWSRLNGLLLISGAFGMFNRQIVIECGGYRSDLVGEDMELIVRMRRYMSEKKEKYKVIYIPDPLCWTEVPTTVKVLGRQRDRWTRGTMESLFYHFKLFFNPRYKTLGMLGHPYWFFFEWLAPLIEALGIAYFVLIAVMGYINWSFFFLLLGVVYSFAVFLTYWAVLFEELSFHRYTRRRDVGKMLFTAFLEPVFYHPMILFFSLRGNIKFFKGEKSWGKMDRIGFMEEQPEELKVIEGIPAELIKEEQILQDHDKIDDRLRESHLQSGRKNSNSGSEVIEQQKPGRDSKAASDL